MVTLRPMVDGDAAGPYLKFMRDPEVLRFLEARFESWDYDKLLVYIGHQRNLGNPFFAILFDSELTGTIKLGLNSIHKFAEVGLMLGHPYWGQGIGTEAIKLVSEYAFGPLVLHKLWAGCYSENIGAIKAFTKAGFQIEGALRSQYRLDGGRWTDDVLLGLVNPNG